MKVKNWNYAGIPVVCLMIALCLYSAYAFFYVDHPELAETSVINISFDLMGMTVCTVIFTSTLLDQRINLSTLLFMCILTLETLLLFWDIESWLADGDPGMVRLNKIAVYYLYGLMLIIVMAYWYYLKELFSKHRRMMDRLTKWLLGLFTVGMVLTVTNPWTGIYFDINKETGIYERADTFFISQAIGIAMTLICLACILICEHRTRRRVVLAGYVVIPLVATGLQMLMYGLSLQYISMLFSIILVYANIYIERSSELIRNESEMTKQRATVMVSQIQPHFLYNALTSIMNIKGNPPETRDAISDFGKYMRSNLDSITQVTPVPVGREMDQVETYIRLRQLKYGDRLVVDIDLDDTGFFIPPMTLKTIVTAAIRYGLSGDDDKLHLDIYSESDAENHVLCIRNRFIDQKSIDFINSSTEEIDSVASRLGSMVGGKLENILAEDGSMTCRMTIPRHTEAKQ